MNLTAKQVEIWRASKWAVNLRKAAARFAEWDGDSDPHDREGDKRHKALLDAALAFADEVIRKTVQEHDAPTPAEQNEIATTRIVSHEYPWCRARLLHALGGAAEQGILDDVIHEVLDERWQDEVLEEMLRALECTGWLRPGHRLIP